MDKKALRAVLTDRLNNLDNVDYVNFSHIVAERLIHGIDWRGVRSVCLYQSQSKWHEIALADVISWIKHQHPSILITIPPAVYDAAIPHGPFDLVIVPLLGFDDDGNRLGRGKGWYDRFLALQPKALKVGVAFETQRVESIPVEVHDVALDVVCTERATYAARD